LAVPFFEPIDVAAGEERFDLGLRRARLQRQKAALDGGHVAVELDEDVAHLVHATAATLEVRDCLDDEAVGAASVGAVAVGRVRPVRRAQNRFVGAVDAAAVPVQAFADRLAVQDGLKAGLTDRFHVPRIARENGTRSGKRIFDFQLTGRDSSKVLIMTPDYSRYRYIAIQREQGIATLTLNQPDNRNAIHAEMHAELEHVWLDLAQDPEVNVIVLTGAGTIFSAGGDIKRMVNRFGSEEGWKFSIETPASTKRLFQSILEVEKPIVAAINGDAVGLGATLALFADSTVIAETAKFGDSHVKVGLVAGDGGAVIWPILVGPNRAKEFLMRGKLMSGKEAHAMGLVNHVVPADQVLAKALEIARELNALPPLAVRWTKLSVNKWIKSQLNLILDASIAYEMLSINSRDHHEAAKAFLEKRPPSSRECEDTVIEALQQRDWNAVSDDEFRRAAAEFFACTYRRTCDT
jgi:enoyl-CoA hydratase/carnithine racemase